MDLSLISEQEEAIESGHRPRHCQDLAEAAQDSSAPRSTIPNPAPAPAPTLPPQDPEFREGEASPHVT